MIKNSIQWLACLLLLMPIQLAAAQEQKAADYKIQGEYSGTIDDDGTEAKFGIQVIALGDGKFAGVGYMGGLPGDGWDRSEPIRVAEAKLTDGILTLQADDATTLVADGVASINNDDGKVVGRLKRVVRKSSTLGKKAPDGATVLFDGSSVDGWEFRGKPAKMTDDGLLMAGAHSKQKFQDHKIHIEFLLPYVPKARGQGRGNSGIYLQGRYEIQILDSFGLTGEHNECGGVYTIRKPDENMCFPPLQWQTYDIEYHAAEFDGDKKTKNAWMNVKHNGVTIHERVELPKKTTAAPNAEGPEAGFVYLQDHGNPVRYRNIWVEEKTGEKKSRPRKTKPN